MTLLTPSRHSPKEVMKCYNDKNPASHTVTKADVMKFRPTADLDREERAMRETGSR